jgi:hypothetical protein
VLRKIEEDRKEQENAAVPDDRQKYLISPYAWAGDRYANVIANQFKDYQERHLPYLQKLIGTVGDKEILEQAEGRINESFDKGAWSAGLSQNINQSRLGLSLNPEEQAVSNRKRNLGLAAGKADAINNTRLHIQDRENATMAGGLGSPLKNAETTRG